MLHRHVSFLFLLLFWIWGTRGFCASTPLSLSLSFSLLLSLCLSLSLHPSLFLPLSLSPPFPPSPYQTHENLHESHKRPSTESKETYLPSTESKETYLHESPEARPATVSKETYCSVKRDLHAPLALMRTEARPPALLGALLAQSPLKTPFALVRADAGPPACPALFSSPPPAPGLRRIGVRS